MLNIAKVEVLIKAKGWSNSYFCGLFGKNRGWIRDWKHGVGLPDENMLQAIADALDTTVDYLTDKTEQKNKPTDEFGELSNSEKRLLQRFRTMDKPRQDMMLRAAGIDPSHPERANKK